MEDKSSQALKCVQAVCPTAVGLAVVLPDDRSTWRIDYADGTTDAQKAAAEAALAAFVVSNVPQSVERRQGRLALNAAGLLSQVEAAVAAADETTQIWYQDAPTWDRADPIIARLATSLNLSSAQVDALFTQAATL